MGDQLANNPEALRLFFTEDIYIVPEAALQAVQVQKEPEASGLVREQPSGEAGIADRAGVVPGVKMPANPAVVPPDPSLIPQINLEQGGSTAGEATPVIREDFVYLGKNKRNILILVNDQDNEVSTEQGRELLKNIVKAINLNGADFALLNYSAYQGTSFRQLQQFFSSKVLFAFGIAAAEIGLQYEDQNSLIMHEGVKMIFSSNLNQLSTDIQGKKALWSCLKQMDI
jgi:DNA polymerase III psi subunit